MKRADCKGRQVKNLFNFPFCVTCNNSNHFERVDVLHANYCHAIDVTSLRSGDFLHFRTVHMSTKMTRFLQIRKFSKGDVHTQVKVFGVYPGFHGRIASLLGYGRHWTVALGGERHCKFKDTTHLDTGRLQARPT